MALTPAQVSEARGHLVEIQQHYYPRSRLTKGGTQLSKCECPVCELATLGFGLGKDHPIVFGCTRDRNDPCPPVSIADRLVNVVKIPLSLLGSYAASLLRADRTPKRPAPTVDYRAECDKLRNALAIERAKVAAVFAVLDDESVTRETQLRAEIMLAATGDDRPDNYRGIVDLALRSGARPTQAKALAHLWLSGSDLLLAS